MSSSPEPHSQERRRCSINDCSGFAITEDAAELAHWYVAVFYCDEHSRELREGTPLGPVGIDPQRVRITPKGTAELPMTSRRFPGLA